MNPDFSIVTKTHSVNGNYAYYINTKPEAIADTGSYLKYSMIYSIPDFVSGDSYTFNFDLLSLEQARVYNKNLSENSMFHGILNNGGKIIVGLGSYNSTIDNVDMIEDASLVINKDNYLQYFGKSNKITFEIPNIVNPCVFITYMEVTSSAGAVSTYLFFDNVSLVNNSDVKEQNFLNKLFSWFQEKFDSIGESFANLGNKLTELKDGFINKITELKTSFENKITDLKESFQAKIDELKQGLIDLKDNLIEGIKSLFVPDEQAILDWKESLNTLLKNHLGIIYTCSELLTDTLNLAFDIIFDAPDTYEIKIPEVSFEAAGTTVPVFSAQNIDFSFMEKPVFKTMYSMYTVALYIFFGGLEVKYALAVYRKVINN